MNGFQLASMWKPSAVIAAVLWSSAEMPPISAQARAGLERTLGTKGVCVSEESAYKFSFPRPDVSVRIGNQRLTADQASKSWATFSPSMHSEGMVIGELIVLEHEANPILSVALKNGLEVTGLGRTHCSARNRGCSR
jgi:hypothetical protein